MKLSCLFHKHEWILIDPEYVLQLNKTLEYVYISEAYCPKCNKKQDLLILSSEKLDLNAGDSISPSKTITILEISSSQAMQIYLAMVEKNAIYIKPKINIIDNNNKK